MHVRFVRFLGRARSNVVDVWVMFFFFFGDAGYLASLEIFVVVKCWSEIDRDDSYGDRYIYRC